MIPAASFAGMAHRRGGILAQHPGAARLRQARSSSEFGCGSFSTKMGCPGNVRFAPGSDRIADITERSFVPTSEVSALSDHSSPSETVRKNVEQEKKPSIPWPRGNSRLEFCGLSVVGSGQVELPLRRCFARRRKPNISRSRARQGFE
jgi:hypothetical protein